jgi:hypothetical protein
MTATGVRDGRMRRRIRSAMRRFRRRQVAFVAMRSNRSAHGVRLFIVGGGRPETNPAVSRRIRCFSAIRTCPRTRA